MMDDSLSIIASDTPERDGRTHHIFREIRRQALIPCRDVTLLDVGHKPLAISLITRIHQPLNRLGLHRLSYHGQQIPLQLLAQHTIRDVVEMDPLLRLVIPSATGGKEVQMGVILPIAPMGLDDHDVAAFEGSATYPAIDIVQ